MQAGLWDMPEHELHNLCVGDEPFPVGRPANGAHHVVVIHDDVDEGVGQQRNVLEGLSIRQPEECHGHNGRMVEDM